MAQALPSGAKGKMVALAKPPARMIKWSKSTSLMGFPQALLVQMLTGRQALESPSFMQAKIRHLRTLSLTPTLRKRGHILLNTGLWMLKLGIWLVA